MSVSIKRRTVLKSGLALAGSLFAPTVLNAKSGKPYKM